MLFSIYVRNPKDVKVNKINVCLGFGLFFKNSFLTLLKIKEGVVFAIRKHEKDIASI
jgi:hypothetical protein